MLDYIISILLAMIWFQGTIYSRVLSNWLMQRFNAIIRAFYKRW